MKCTSLQSLGDQPIKHGEVVHACAVSGANVVRDMREVVTNVIGGKMKRYEAVLDDTIARAIENLKAKAEQAGVAQKLIATASDLDAIAAGDRSGLALTGWRRDVFGEDALRLCDGEIGLAVKGEDVTVFELNPAG